MENVLKKIEHIRQNGYHLDFGDTFSETFDKWKKLFGYGALAIIISIVFYYLISFIFGMIGLSAGNEQELMQKIMSNQGDPSAMMDIYKEYFSQPMVIGSAILQSLFMFLAYPISAGLVYMAYKYDTTNNLDISDLFEGYRGSNFGKLAVLFLIYKLASFLGLCVFLIGFFVPFVGFSIASSFIIINKMDVMDAIKASFQVTFKNFFIVLFLLIVSFLFYLAGALACFIGLIFTYAFIPIMTYSIYKMSIGIEAVKELDELGKE